MQSTSIWKIITEERFDDQEAPEARLAAYAPRRTSVRGDFAGAAMSLGATRVQAFFKVTLPLLRSSLLSGAIFAFIISFSDINLALFLSGPESTSLPVHIFSQIQWQGDPTIAAASSLQIVIIGMLILVVQRIFRLRLVV